MQPHSHASFARRTWLRAAAAACTPAVLALLAACGGGAAAPNAESGGPVTPLSDLANPPEVTSENGNAYVALTAEINPQTGGPGLAWNALFTPPTIRVAPGDTVHIYYTNNLPPSTIRPLNSVNLHFAGLHVSPNAPADDSLDMFARPGQTLQYQIHIPADHPTGVFLYRSDVPGEANWQAYNGMSGALVVTGTQAFAPLAAGLPERILILRNVLAHPDFSLISPLDLTATQDTSCLRPFDIPGETTTLNGAAPGRTLFFVPGQSQYWRVVNASADGFYTLAVDGATLHIVAVDGIPLAAAAQSAPQNASSVIVPPSGRVEFVIGNITQGAALRTGCYAAGIQGEPNPSQVLAQLSNGPTSGLPLVPAGGTKPPAGTWAQALNGFSLQRTLTFGRNGTVFSFNAIAFAPSNAPLFTPASGTVEQWTLVNPLPQVQVFHLHQTDFLVQDTDGTPVTPVLRDTAAIAAAHADGTPSTTHILVDFRDPLIRGTFPFESGLLAGHDAGLAATVQVR